MTIDRLPKFTEFECKYRTEKDILKEFIRIANSIPNQEDYLEVKGPDTFFVNPGINHFGRYRKSDIPDSNGNFFAQWTIKEKQEGAKNSINRFESNWIVTGTPTEEVYAALEKMGYKKVGKIHKHCYIYKFIDATIVFYTVVSDNSAKEAHFIEIEVDEHTIDRLTEDEAWKVIEKYENILADTGISAKKRMRLSLFDMYREDQK
jgi:adenylate cyclase class IV